MGRRYRPGDGFRFIIWGLGLLLLLVTGLLDWALKSPFPGAFGFAAGFFGVIIGGGIAGRSIYKRVERSAGEAKAKSIDGIIFWAGLAVTVAVSLIMLRKFK